jgi:hypothetical protein
MGLAAGEDRNVGGGIKLSKLTKHKKCKLTSNIPFYLLIY